MLVRKMLAWVVGGSCAISVVLGALLLIPSKMWSVFVAVTVICLSLASGLLMPNPISIWTLIAGVCMIVFPAWCVGIILIVLGDRKSVV